MAILSILGLYNYRPDIFDDMVLPTAADLNPDIPYIDPLPELKKEDLIENICFNLAELSLVYADPDIMRRLIGLWSRTNKANFRDLWATVCYKYNPIWNKDGTIRETRDRTTQGQDQRDTEASGTLTAGQSDTGQVADAGSTTSTETLTGRAERDDTTTHKVTGYDTDSLSDSYSDVLDGETDTTQTVDGSGTSDNTRNISNRMDRSESTGSTGSESGSRSEEISETYERVEQGNIGVTTTQTMIREARDIATFNIYDVITESFKERFCIMIY